MNIEPIFNFLFKNLKTKKRKLIINKIKNVQDLKNKIIFGKYNILIIKKKSNKAIKIINLFSFLFFINLKTIYLCIIFFLIGQGDILINHIL